MEAGGINSFFGIKLIWKLKTERIRLLENKKARFLKKLSEKDTR